MCGRSDRAVAQAFGHWAGGAANRAALRVSRRGRGALCGVDDLAACDKLRVTSIWLGRLRPMVELKASSGSVSQTYFMSATAARMRTMTSRSQISPAPHTDLLLNGFSDKDGES